MITTTIFDIDTQLSGGNGVNEDVYGHTSNAAWVIDGATGLSEQQFSDRKSDGLWFVSRISDRLSVRMNHSHPLQEIILQCVKDVASEYDDLTAGTDVDEIARPSGAIAVARWDTEALEYFVLGDCSCIITHSSDKTTEILGEGPRRFDQRVVEMLQKLICERNYSYEAAREQVQPLLTKHRRLKNKGGGGGYWTLGLSSEAVTHAESGVIPITEIDAAYLFSDGFESLVNTYDVFTDWNAATEYLQTNGDKRAFRLLRDIEAGDPECEKYPRLKPSDDAALVTISR